MPSITSEVKPKAPDLDVEMGVATTLPFVSDGDVTNIEPVPIDKLIQMRKSDGQVRALMRLLTLPILSALKESGFKPEDGGEAEAEFMEQCIKLPPQLGGMTHTFARFMRETLLALVEGYSAFEKVWHVPDKGPLKGKITLLKLAHRASHTIRFRVDERGDFDGIHQIASVGGRSIDVKIPARKCFYYAANEEENPFYGVPYFLPAFYHWDKKVKLYYVAHIAAQFSAVPGRIGKHPANPDPKQKAAFKTALASFGFNTAMLVPENWEVDGFESKSTFDYLKLIEHHNNQMSKSVLAQFIDSDNQKDTLVDFGSDKDEMFVLGLTSIMDEIAANINHFVVPQLIDWNFGSGKYPVFQFAPLSDTTKDVLTDVFKTISTAQTTNVTPEFIRECEKRLAERLAFEIDYEELQAEWEAEKEEQKELESAQRQAQTEMAKNPPAPAAPGAAPAPGAKPTAPKPSKDEKIAASAESTAPIFLSVEDIVEQVNADLLELTQATAEKQPRTKNGRWRDAGEKRRAEGAIGTKPGEFVPDDLRAANQRLANKAIRNAPKPTAEDVARHEAMVAKSKRQGGDGRGGAPARRNRTQKLLKLYGDGKTCPCVFCGQVLTAATLSQDRIVPGKLGGGYGMRNIVPTDYKCNNDRGDIPIGVFRGVGRK